MNIVCMFMQKAVYLHSERVKGADNGFLSRSAIGSLQRLCVGTPHPFIE